MANIQHGTLTANTVTTITASTEEDFYGSAEILNRNGAGEIYFRVDGTAPTIGGEDSYVVPGQIGALQVEITPAAQVQLISSAACTFTVTFE